MMHCVKPGHPILLAEGKMKLTVIDVKDETDVLCKVGCLCPSCDFYKK